MREWLARLRDWLRRDRLDEELTEELRFHQDQLERGAAAGGADGEEAGYAARRRLGNLTRIREESRDRATRCEDSGGLPASRRPSC